MILLVDQDVLGLDVAVDDVLLVDVVQRLGDLEHDLARLADAEPLLAEQHAVERLALDELHHHEHADLLVLAEVDDGRDARVAHRRGEPRLAIEQLARLVGLGDLVRDDLQRERARQVGVGDLVDLAHPALADALDDLVAAADQRRVLRGVDAAAGAARRRHRRVRPPERGAAGSTGLPTGFSARSGRPAAVAWARRSRRARARDRAPRPGSGSRGSTRTSLESSCRWTSGSRGSSAVISLVGSRACWRVGRQIVVLRGRQGQRRGPPARGIALIRHARNRTRVTVDSVDARPVVERELRARTCCRCRSRSRRRRC